MCMCSEHIRRIRTVICSAADGRLSSLISEKKMKIDVVEFEKKYMDGALEIMHETNSLHIENAPDFFAKIGKDGACPYLEWVLSDKRTFGYVALADGQVAGLLTAEEQYRKGEIFKVKHYYEILDIAVGQNYQKLGIGRKLHQKLVARAKTQKICQIELQVFEFNRSAMSFYKKLNYKEISRTMGFEVK